MLIVNKQYTKYYINETATYLERHCRERKMMVEGGDSKPYREIMQKTNMIQKIN